MRGLLCVLVLAGQVDEPELPPPLKVTLRFEKVQAVEALRRFSEATRVPMGFYQGRHGWEVEEEDQEKLMAVDLKDVPFFDAVARFCEAHGNLGYTIGERMKITFQGLPAGSRGSPMQGRFLFWHGQVEEETSSDFVRRERSCTLHLGMAWQPDLRVLADGPLWVETATDDAGTELLSGTKIADSENRWRECDQRPISRTVKLPLPPRPAHRLNLKGWVELDLPRRTTFLEIPLRAPRGSNRFGAYGVEGLREGEGAEARWTFVVRPSAGKLEPEQLLDLRIGRGNGYEFWVGWGKDGGARTRDDGSLELRLADRRTDDLYLRFTIVEGKCRTRAPFELKGIPLPR